MWKKLIMKGKLVAAFCALRSSVQEFGLGLGYISDLQAFFALESDARV